MKAVLISDSHGLHKNYGKLPDGDILIHSGDVGANGYMDLYDFLEWFKSQPHKYKIFIGGNHDKFLALDDLRSREMFKDIKNLFYLKNDGCEIEGIKFWGSPMTPRFLRWYFMADRNKMNKYWDEIPLDTKVLITHGSPYGILDQTLLANGEPGDRVGCFQLLNKMKELKNLKYHIFGHIHGEYGIKIINGTTFINASSCDEEYNLVNLPIVVEI
jgi:Icc-related predicted phosphoesterase